MGRDWTQHGLYEAEGDTDQVLRRYGFEANVSDERSAKSTDS